MLLEGNVLNDEKFDNDNWTGSSNGSVPYRRHHQHQVEESETNGTQARRANGQRANTAKEKALMKLEEVPVHLRFNKYVLGHYRAPLNLIGCLKSLFYLHNETINVLTHAIPIFAIGWSIPYLLPYDEITVPYLPTIHIIASMAPWLGSTFYHLFMSHRDGYPVYKMLLTLDVLGIWVTQVTGGLVTICATIYCLSAEVQKRFLIFYAFLCIYCLYKAMTAQCPWSRRFSFTSPFLVRMVMLFLRTVGLGAGNPASFVHVILQDAIGITGAFIGVTNIPERWFPGSLDLFFNSHHIMHVLVVYAVYEMHKASTLDLLWMTQVNANMTECPNKMGDLWQEWSSYVVDNTM